MAGYEALKEWHGSGEYSFIGPEEQTGGICPRCGCLDRVNYGATIRDDEDEIDVCHKCYDCGLYYHDIGDIVLIDDYKCPLCGSSDLEDGDYDDEFGDGEYITLSCTCKKCGNSFDLRCWYYTNKVVVDMSENK